MSSREFAEQMAYESIEPSEPVRGDIRTAQLCALLANIWRDGKKKKTPYAISDFILDFSGKKKETKRTFTKEDRQNLKGKIKKFFSGIGIEGKVTKHVNNDDR